jgi:hypothetical protein
LVTVADRTECGALASARFAAAIDYVVAKDYPARSEVVTLASTAAIAA